MEQTTSTTGDRRRSFRVPVSAAAAVRTRAGLVSTYAVNDVSLGGALLSGAPVIARGSKVDVVIRCVGSPPMCVAGRVVRHSATRRARPRWAIRFRDIPAEAEDAIHDLSVATLERGPSVLVVDRSDQANAELAAEVRQAGLRPLTASTPLEAIELLHRNAGQVVSAVIGRVSDPDGWLGLLELLREEFPAVRRVAWVGSAGRFPRRAARPAASPADAVLFGKWDRASLTRALGIQSSAHR